MSTKLMKSEEVAAFMGALAATIDPRCELNWQIPLDLTVAVVLSAQCSDRKVNEVTADLFARCRTPQDYLDLGEDALREAIHSLGLYRNKARSIIGICEQLLVEHNGEVPDEREALEALPGIGRKSANVILNVVFGHPTLAVDTHVQRVANRTGLARGKTPAATEKSLLKRLPEEYLPDAHHYLILHGRYTCKARRPECWGCPAVEPCHYADKELEAPE